MHQTGIWQYINLPQQVGNNTHWPISTVPHRADDGAQTCGSVRARKKLLPSYSSGVFKYRVYGNCPPTVLAGVHYDRRPRLLGVSEIAVDCFFCTQGVTSSPWTFKVVDCTRLNMRSWNDSAAQVACTQRNLTYRRAANAQTDRTETLRGQPCICVGTLGLWTMVAGTSQDLTWGHTAACASRAAHVCHCI